MDGRKGREFGGLHKFEPQLPAQLLERIPKLDRISPLHAVHNRLREPRIPAARLQRVLREERLHRLRILDQAVWRAPEPVWKHGRTFAIADRIKGQPDMMIQTSRHYTHTCEKHFLPLSTGTLRNWCEQ